MKSTGKQARLACTAAALAGAVIACAADRPIAFTVPDKQLQALGIQVAPLQRTGDSIGATFPAQVIIPPDREQVVSAPLAGVIVQVLVQLNQPVREGTALVRIASPELGQQQLQLLHAASRADLALQAARREQSLFDEGIIPQRRVQESQAALREGRAALAQARAALRLSGMPVVAIDRIVLSGKLEDTLTLQAPRAGLITRLEAKPGQRVEPAAALAHVAQTDKLSLDIQVPATDVSRWKPGARLKVQGREALARVVSSSPLVTPGSQTVAIRAEIEAGVNSLRAGESVAVEMPGGATAGWELPLAAVAHDGAQAFVFVKTQQGFEGRPVIVVASAGQKVSVQGALAGGEQVAVTGVVALKGAWLAEKDKGSK